MIYTLALDPSVDYSVRFWGQTQIGEVNICVSDMLMAGGKGVNCAIVLHRLGQEVTALGFLGGTTGEMVRDALLEEGVVCAMDSISTGQTRINVKIRDGDGVITGIRGKSYTVTPDDTDALRSKLCHIGEGDVLIFSGSAPDGMTESDCRDIVGSAVLRGALCALDVSADILLPVLEYKPFLVKCDKYELSRIFGKDMDKEESTAMHATAMQATAIHATELCRRGACHVLVSLGDEGMMLACADGSVYTVPDVPVKLKSTVGCSDSMLAGFISAYLDSGDAVGALRMGNACKSATAGSDRLCLSCEAERLYEISKGTVVCMRKGEMSLF